MIIEKIKQLKLFETFAGIGSQHKALHNIENELNFKIKLNGMAEWDVNSITAYHRIHCENYVNDYINTFKDLFINHNEDLKEIVSKDLLNKINNIKNYQDLHLFIFDNKQQVLIKTLKQCLIKDIQNLIEKRNFVFSNDTKTPIKNFNSLKFFKLLSFYSANKRLNNFTSVTILKDKVKEIENIDIFTYSFPCQAISLQGKQEGLVEDSGTSSSLLWSIRDFLNEIYKAKENKEKNNFKKLINLPRFLLMENVAALYNPKNKNEWDRFKSFLSKIGYETEEVILKASNFGMPQNRDRAFALSVLKEKNKNYLQVLNDFKNLENIKKDLYFIDHFLSKLNKEELKNLVIEEKYQIQKEKFKEAKVTKNHIKKIVLDNYTTFQSENMVYHSKESVSPTITAQGAQSRIKIYDENNNVIRYMTSLEHLKLMGFEEKDYYSIIKANNEEFTLNENLIKKMAGNSIVVNVLEEIFKIIVKYS